MVRVCPLGNWTVIVVLRILPLLTLKPGEGSIVSLYYPNEKFSSDWN